MAGVSINNMVVIFCIVVAMFFRSSISQSNIDDHQTYKVERLIKEKLYDGLEATYQSTFAILKRIRQEKEVKESFFSIAST